MKAHKLHRRVDADGSDTRAMESAENEGWPAMPGIVVGRRPSSPAYVRGPRKWAHSLLRGVEAWAGTRQLSLKQLHAELAASALPVAGCDRARGRLIALIGADLRDAERWPVEGHGPESSKPLSAWRARYNGIDRCLRARAASTTPS